MAQVSNILSITTTHANEEMVNMIAERMDGNDDVILLVCWCTLLDCGAKFHTPYSIYTPIGFFPKPVKVRAKRRHSKQNKKPIYKRTRAQYKQRFICKYVFVCIYFNMTAFCDKIALHKHSVSK